MQKKDKSNLDVIYKKWHSCQEKLRGCIAPLMGEQLALQLARGL